jgi:hypothetical protein
MRKAIGRLPPFLLGLVVVLGVLAGIIAAGWLTGVVGRHAGLFPYHYTRGCGLSGVGECDDQLDGPATWTEYFGYGLVVWIVGGFLYACYCALKILGLFIGGGLKIREEDQSERHAMLERSRARRDRRLARIRGQ